MAHIVACKLSLRDYRLLFSSTAFGAVGLGGWRKEEMTIDTMEFLAFFLAHIQWQML